MTALDFREATREIEGLLALHPKGFDLSLDRIENLLEILGRPQDRLPPVIHVAGTNGKGSLTAFARSILEASGLSVHVHTSPHLVNWHERYRLGVAGGRGQLVGDAVLADAVRRVAEANDGRRITVFEILTAVTFVLFSEHPADVAIIEVGLGGRFDATNVLARPAVSVIMPISLDHQAFLGDRVELIAAEKAGIMKRGLPVVIGHQDSDAARQVLVSTAERLGCPLSVYGQDFMAHEEFGRLIYQDETGLSDLPLPRLPGRHQHGNAAAAIRAVRAAGFRPSEQAIEKGLSTVEWAGRLQRLQTGIIAGMGPAGAEIWVDGGHNPGAGQVIAETMAGLEERDSRPLFLVTGMINTKDPVGYFEAFRGLAEQVMAVPIAGSDAGLDPVAIADAAGTAGLDARAVSTVEEALATIAEIVRNDPVPPRILIGGSLYLVGDVLSQNEAPPQ